MLFIARYNHPSADDYYFAGTTAHIWRETGSIAQTVSASVEHMKMYYGYIQGTFVAVFLMSLQPLVFGESLYMLGSFMLIIGLAASTLFFLKVVLVNFFKADKYTSGIIALVFTIVSMQFIISPVEAFYWYTGSMFYILFHCFALVMFSLILLSQKTEKRYLNIIYTIISAFLAFAIGGGNFVTALTAILILGLIFVYRIIFCRSKWIIPLLCLVFIGISFLISVTAPGNAYRQQYGDQMDPIMAVLSSFRHSALFMTTHIKPPVWLAFGCIVTVIYRVVKTSEYSFRYPGLVTAVLYGVYTSTFVPTLYSWSSTGPLRVLNINYLAFLFFLFFAVIYWCGWISKIINNMAETNGNNTSAKTENLKTVKSAVHEILVLLLIVGCAALLSVSFTSITGVSAMRSIMNGEARVYHNEHLIRREIVRDPELSSVALKALTFNPYVIFFEDITYYPDDGRNRTMADYYGIDSIKLVYELPLYHVGNNITFGITQDEIDSPRKYFVFGLDDWSEHDFTWSNNIASVFRAGLETPVHSDLRLDMTAKLYEHNEMYVGQTLKVYVDGNYIDEIFISDGGKDVFNNITFDIPKEFVSRRNFLELRFEFPDAYHPMELWDDSSDEEIRAIGFRSITLTVLDKG